MMKDLAVIETILRNRTYFFNEIRQGINLPEKMRANTCSMSAAISSSFIHNHE